MSSRDPTAGQTSVDQWTPRRSDGQLRLSDLPTRVSSDADRCPYCGEDDEEVCRHVLEHHPEVILDRLDELVDGTSEMWTVDEEQRLPPSTADEDDTLSAKDLNVDPSGPPECANCGTTVSRDYVRVFSDDEDNTALQHCHACRSRSERY